MNANQFSEVAEDMHAAASDAELIRELMAEFDAEEDRRQLEIAEAMEEARFNDALELFSDLPHVYFPTRH